MNKGDRQHRQRTGPLRARFRPSLWVLSESTTNYLLLIPPGPSGIQNGAPTFLEQPSPSESTPLISGIVRFEPWADFTRHHKPLIGKLTRKLTYQTMTFLGSIISWKVADEGYSPI